MDASFYHVFSYSERPNTKSATFSDKVTHRTIHERSKILHQLAEEKQRAFYQKNLGKKANVLFESNKKDGLMFGFTENYIKVEIPFNRSLIGEIRPVKLIELSVTGNVKAKML